MSISGSTTIKPKNSGLTEGRQSQGVTYHEPTYHLHLTPVKASQTAHIESLAKKNLSYQSLDHLVEQAAQERYKDTWKRFPPSRKKTIRQQLAHSFMPRSDQKSSMKIQKTLAQKQGLSEQVALRLQGIANQYSLQQEVDWTPVADLLFSSHDDSMLPELITHTLYGLLGSNPSLTPLKNDLFKEVMTIQQEIRAWTDTTMIYIRPSQLTDGQTYINHLGETVALSQTIPSSYDRDHPDVQNGRLNLDSNGHVIYSTGRMETERKAHQVIDKLIEHTLASGQITTLSQQSDGSYIYPILVDNLMNPSPTAQSERKYLEEQDRVLKSLDGKIKEVKLNDGTIIKLILKPIHFSTLSNYNTFFGQANQWTSTGSDLSERISQEGIQSLRTIYEQRKGSLPVDTQTAIDNCLTALENKPAIQDRFILRAFICEMLHIPYHINCKSSKDRTAVVAAIKKALHQWIGLERWKNGDKLTISDPRQLLDNPIFREYSEAALFENLPATDQGIGFSGELGGYQYTQNRGFDYRFSILENSLPSFVLSDRYLYKTSIISRISSALVTSMISLVAATLYIVLSPLILIVLYAKFKDRALMVAKYLFLSLLLFPTRSILRPKWIDRTSAALQQRSFFRTHHSKKIDPSLQTLFDQIKRLPSDQQSTLIQFVKTGTELEISEESKQILQNIANNWLILQRRLKSEEPLPSCLKAILEAAPSSPVVLFQYLKNFSQEVMFDQIQKAQILWPAENYVDEIIRHGIVEGKIPLTDPFFSDQGRSHHIVRGKNHCYDFPSDYENKPQALAAALQDLSVFKGCEGIPYPIQEALSQKTALPHVMNAIYCSINQPLLGPPNSDDRTFILEEGDDSFFWLTLKEKSVFKDTTLEADAISFEYNYTFKLTKINEQQWTTTVAAFSPLQPKIEKLSDALLACSDARDLSEDVLNTACGALLLWLSFNLGAAAAWTTVSPLPIKAVEERLSEHLRILSTTYASQLFKNSSLALYYFKQSVKNIKTDEGRELIIQTLISYFKLLNEDQIMEIFIQKPDQNAKELSKDKDLVSRLLKEVLSPENYKEASNQLELDPLESIAVTKI